MNRTLPLVRLQKHVIVPYIHRYYLSTTTDSTQQYNRNQSIVDYCKQYGTDALLGKFPNKPNRYDSIFHDMNIIHIDKQNNTVTCELTVSESMTNSYGTMHGGCIGTLIDVLGTLACLVNDPSRAGISLDINVSFVNAIKTGENIQCVGKLLKTGKTIAFTQIDLYRSGDYRHIASGRHTKILPTPAIK